MKINDIKSVQSQNQKNILADQNTPAIFRLSVEQPETLLALIDTARAGQAVAEPHLRAAMQAGLVESNGSFKPGAAASLLAQVGIKECKPEYPLYSIIDKSEVNFDPKPSDKIKDAQAYRQRHIQYYDNLARLKDTSPEAFNALVAASQTSRAMLEQEHNQAWQAASDTAENETRDNKAEKVLQKIDDLRTHADKLGFLRSDRFSEGLLDIRSTAIIDLAVTEQEAPKERSIYLKETFDFDTLVTDDNRLEALVALYVARPEAFQTLASAVDHGRYILEPEEERELQAFLRLHFDEEIGIDSPDSIEELITKDPDNPQLYTINFPNDWGRVALSPKGQDQGPGSPKTKNAIVDAITTFAPEDGAKAWK